MFLENNMYDNNLFEPDTGLCMGNMFRNEYKGFESYTEDKLIATNDKEKLLLNIYELDFAINDLSLYLDLHPENKNIFNKYSEYVNKYNIYLKKYEESYGPMELNTTTYDKYKWMNIWPFDGGVL